MGLERRGRAVHGQLEVNPVGNAREMSGSGLSPGLLVGGHVE
jgi:hypothetical protein